MLAEKGKVRWGIQGAVSIIIVGDKVLGKSIKGTENTFALFWLFAHLLNLACGRLCTLHNRHTSLLVSCLDPLLSLGRSSVALVGDVGTPLAHT